MAEGSFTASCNVLSDLVSRVTFIAPTLPPESISRKEKISKKSVHRPFIFPSIVQDAREIKTTEGLKEVERKGVGRVGWIKKKKKRNGCGQTNQQAEQVCHSLLGPVSSGHLWGVL